MPSFQQERKHGISPGQHRSAPHYRSGGVKLWRSVCANLLPQIESSITTPAALDDQITEGHDGIKSGKGFYDYSVDFSEEDLNKAVKQRDREFLNRLNNLYLEK